MDSVELASTAAAALYDAQSQVIFGVPGGGNNLDLVGAAEAHGIRFVLTHTEAAAAYMAGAYSEILGIPTACVVTRGPGAASAVNGVANAWLDRQPMIMITDAVSDTDRARISHQRVDQRSLFGPITNWSAVLGAADPASTMRRALAAAAGPRPGPVHLDFDPTSTEATACRFGSRDPESGSPSMGLNRTDWSGRRIVLILGMGAKAVRTSVQELVRGTNIPVLHTYKAKGIIPDSWPNVAGLFTGAAMEAPLIRSADTVLMIGMDSVELIPNSWPYDAEVISLSSWTDEAGYIAKLASWVGDLTSLIDYLPSPLPDAWEPGFVRAHVEQCDRAFASPAPSRLGMWPTDVVRLVQASAPKGSIATVDAGAHMLVAMPLWGTESPEEIMISSGLATMGFSLPAAIAAAIAHPDRRVYCFVGDGGIGMVLAELETLARLQLAITVVVFNDSTLSLIKIKQRGGQGGDNAVAYRRSDFAAIARGFGLAAATVSQPDQLNEALARSSSSASPLVLDVQVDPSSYPDIMRAIRGS